MKMATGEALKIANTCSDYDSHPNHSSILKLLFQNGKWEIPTTWIYIPHGYFK